MESSVVDAPVPVAPRGMLVGGALFPVAALGALAGLLLPLLPTADLLSALSSWPTPLGVFPVAAACAAAIYLAVRRARRALALGIEVRPMRALPPNPKMPSGLREALEGAARTAAAGPRSPPGPSEPRPGERETTQFEGNLADLPVLAAHAVRIPQRRGYSAYTLPVSAVAGTAARAPPPASPPPKGGFGWKVALAYAAISLPILGYSPYGLALLRQLFLGVPFPSTSPPPVPYFFSYYDVLVQYLGALIYYPQTWPGPPYFLQSLSHTAADYIFTMYLVLMLAFLVASGVLGPGRYSLTQRGTALGILGGYVVAALFTEVFFYAIRPALFYSSIALLGRAFIGGLFFAFLLFSVLMAPPVMVVRPRFRRDRAALAVFFLSAASALALAFLVLFGAYELLGVGRTTSFLALTGDVGFTLYPFALLLLLPLLALTFWAIIGRSLYRYELRLRPVPSLWKYHPPVSIIIPAYNEESTIGATVLSADRAARLYPGAVEIIVGNDGSTDRTSQVAKEAVGRLRHAQGRVVDLPHGGKSNALNGALRTAMGEIVVRVDADTRMSPDFGFAEMVPHFADPEVGGVQGLLLPLQSEGWTRKLRMLEIVWNHLFLRRAFYGTRTAQVVDGAFCAFRKADILSVGGWVPWNGEDTEITYRLQRIGFRFRYETRAVAYEDVPANYKQLKKQRIRWTRGGYFAHHRHYPALFSDAPEFGGLAILFWLALFVRGGMRHMVYIYAVLMTFLLGLQTLWHIAIVVALLLLPRGLAMAYYLVRLNAWKYLPWILMWPVTSAVKQFISMEGLGSILPGSMPEFSE